MRRTFLALSLATLTFVGFGSTFTAAQGAKTAHGTVKAITAGTVTVAVGAQEMKFTVDSKTEVEAVGAGTQTRKAVAAGQPGAKLADLIKTGMTVDVSYTDAGGAMHATRIKQVPAAAVKSSTESSNGTVQSVAAGSMTISGSSGSGASFTQTFVIDGNTSVIGIGAGTAAAAAGGKVAFTSLVGKGDKVSVSYHTTGATLHAAEVRVTAKGPK